MRHVRKPDVITAAPRATTRIRSFMRGNSSGRRLRLLDVALDGAGVKPAKGDHINSPLCKVTTD